MTAEPCYLELFRTGELELRAASARKSLEDCDLCSRYCHVDRLASREGTVCRTAERAVVHSYGPHHGEEDPLRGVRGSGTVFFSWCNLRCVYCQNWEISHKGSGYEVNGEALAGMMLDLQARGCHNINFVSPSHVTAQIIEAVLLAAGKGLRLPLVYNTGGYDSIESLKLLDGIIDIYMPDMKYGDSGTARTYSKVPNYAEANRVAVREMHRQVGDLVLDRHGIASRGLLIRHLVLPGGLAGTERILAFIAHELSTDTYLNLMDQYRPCYRADEFPVLCRGGIEADYEAALKLCKRYGLWRLDRRRSSFF